ncbi:MAG TPA: hypothetical protein VIV60_25655 [Polyangiaceae bacterium]
MKTIKTVYLTFVKLLAREPALSASLLNVGVACLAYFGWHLSPEQLLAVVGVVTTLFGVIVRSNVKPLAKVEQSVEVIAQADPDLTVGRAVVEELRKINMQAKRG